MERERQITGDLHGALISKPRGRPIEDAFVVMRLGDWVDWLVERSQERPSLDHSSGSRFDRLTSAERRVASLIEA
jgi:hypothetical protein